MSLTGVWMNELRSVLVLREHKDKSLTGQYRSMVGRDPKVRHLSGRTSAAEGGKQDGSIRGVFRDRRAGTWRGPLFRMRLVGLVRKRRCWQLHDRHTLAPISQFIGQGGCVGRDQDREEHVSESPGNARRKASDG